jgi:type I restriction enzyme, S subunit
MYEMKYERLGNICSIRNGFAFKSDDFSDDGIPIIRISDLSDGVATTLKAQKVKENVHLERYKIKKGDILVAMSGATTGKYAKYVSEDIAYQNQRIGCFVIKNHNILNKEFLYFSIASLQKQIEKKAYGGAQPNISANDIENLKIALPPLEDQIRVATILSKAEALIKQRKESIALLDEFLKSTFLEMFGDPVRNEKGWEKKRLGKLVNIENDKRIPVKQADRNLREGIYPYYGATGIIDTIDDYKFDGTYLLIAEDGKNLLYRQKNNAFIAKGKFWVNNHAHVLSFNGLSNLRYLEFTLNNINLQPYLSGTDQIKLNREALEKILISTPPTELQTQFAQIVEKTEALKKQYQASLEELKQFFGSLSQKVFKGELDLSRVEIEEEEENLDGGFVITEEAEPIIEVLQNDTLTYLNSLPRIKSKDSQKIKEIRDLDFQKLQVGNIRFNENYAKYRILAPLFEAEESKTFGEIYASMEEFKDITYEQVKYFVFKGLTGEKPYFEQVFDRETKEIRHKFLL